MMMTEDRDIAIARIMRELFEFDTHFLRALLEGLVNETSGRLPSPTATLRIVPTERERIVSTERARARKPAAG